MANMAAKLLEATGPVGSKKKAKKSTAVVPAPTPDEAPSVEAPVATPPKKSSKKAKHAAAGEEGVAKAKKAKKVVEPPSEAAAEADGPGAVALKKKRKPRQGARGKRLVREMQRSLDPIIPLAPFKRETRRFAEKALARLVDVEGNGGIAKVAFRKTVFPRLRAIVEDELLARVQVARSSQVGMKLKTPNTRPLGLVEPIAAVLSHRAHVY